MSRVLPILFNTEMVRAILDGRKTCTRRIIKPQPTEHLTCGSNFKQLLVAAASHVQVGDTIYVRETWGYPISLDSEKEYIYRADNVAEYGFNNDSHRWHPSIHMPKEAARIWLKVTDVRVERLHEIDGKGCIAEGIEPEALTEVGEKFMRGMFSDLWDSTVKKSDLDTCSWQANPWVWVIEFERCEKPHEV